MRLTYISRNFDDEIDNFMKPEEKRAASAIEEVTGIGHTSAQAIVSVIGTDMRRFPTDTHISSWAGLCPGDNESAGKRKSGKTRKGNALLRSTLVTCAHATTRNKNSYFYAQFMRISAHCGKKCAYVAVAHSMLTAIYHILKDGVVSRIWELITTISSTRSAKSGIGNLILSLLFQDVSAF